MKISCCPVQTSCALLIGHEYALSEMVVWCLLIAQRASVLEREPWFVLQVRPYGRTMLKSGLRWSTTWWRRAIFYRHRPIDRWVLIGEIDHFPIATPDHADSSDFIVRSLPKANSKDQVVIDAVLIGSRAGLSIRFVVAGCLMITWNVVTEFLRPRSRSSSCATLLVLKPGGQDRRLIPPWIAAFKIGIACPSETAHRRSTASWVHRDRSQCFPPSWCASVNDLQSDIWSINRENVSRWDQSQVNMRHEV
jgi:hypothetical protein